MIKRLLAMSVLSMVLLIGGAAQGQGGSPEVVINYPELSPNEDGSGLELQLYFSLVQDDGRPVTAASISNAEIVLDDGNVYRAETSRPTSPFYVVLALDSSGSMSTAMPVLRQAATDFVMSAPPQIQFALLGFDETITVAVDSTPEREQIVNGIEQLTAINGRGTCLYDTTLAAINTLATAPPGRRAVVLFTDGRDELLSGDPCSEGSFRDVLELANDPDYRVPIYTIGLSDEINAVELEQMAGETGGVALTGSDLSALFSRIGSILNSQWVARAVVYPQAGSHIVSLRIDLTGNIATEPDAVTIYVSANYAPPSAPQLAIRAINHDPARQTLQIVADINNVSNVAAYRVRFISPQTRQVVHETLVTVPPYDVVTVSSADLEPGDYEVVLAALDVNDAVLMDDDPFPYELVAPETPTTTIRIANVEVDRDSGEVVVAVEGANREAVEVYVIGLRDVNGTALQTLEHRPPPHNRISLPMTDVPEGTYTIDISAYDADNELLDDAAIQIAYTPPTNQTADDDETFLEEWGLWLLIISGLLILAFALVVLFWPRRSKVVPYKPVVVTPGRYDPEGTKITYDEAGRTMVSSSGFHRIESTQAHALPSGAEATNPGEFVVLPHATLRVRESREPTAVDRKVTITDVPWLLGRAVPTIDFAGDDRVSRHHAHILYEDGRYYIEDLDSTHGTIVNGVRIEPHQRIQLEDGDEIGLGPTTTLIFNTTLGKDMDRTNPVIWDENDEQPS